MKIALILVLLLGAGPLLALAPRNGRLGPDRVDSVELPASTGASRFYVSNRAPLRPSPLLKLPIGAIEPRGWLRRQLELMRDGFTGRLSELSRFVKSDSGWLTGSGQGWEEVPYWLKGFGDLGYILKDTRLQAEARRWLDDALASQGPDGYFGPPRNRNRKDLWPNMIMLFALQSLAEATGDPRVIPFMQKYFRYELDLPEAELLPSSWQKLRGGDNLESVYWLYNRTGDPWLLDLGRKLFRRTSDWTSPVLTPARDAHPEPSSFYHGVNIAMGLREPGVYYQQSGDPRLLEAVERNYRLIREAYGQQPGGMFGADENIRPGATDPRQGAETCTMVELMYSHESLLRITGRTRYAERCEDIAFNSLPASVTPDLKGLHYLTAANLISCDSSGEHDFENRGTLVSFDPRSYRCCQHNFAFGWPYFAEHLWCATLDDGLASVLYAPSAVTAKVGEGVEVKLTEDTSYPFGPDVELTVEAEKPVRFPLYLRVPEWCREAGFFVNGRRIEASVRPSVYLRLERTWRGGDTVKLVFPARVEVVTWPGVGGAVSVRRGGLWYSLKIGEEWKRYGGTDDWPAYEVLPTTPWNYALVLDPDHPERSIRLSAEKAVSAQPFVLEAAPVVLKARGVRVPQWKAEGRMAGKVPPSPVRFEGPVEDVELIPMGCARLRLSVFPLAAGTKGGRQEP
jgi:hypothetical protein